MGETLSESNLMEKGKQLLKWNQEKLTHKSDLNIHDIKDLFAPEFTVIANERKYSANHQNYYEFLNQFRSNIEKINYEVQEYLIAKSTVIIPLTATVQRVDGKKEVFDAIMILKFDESGKIIHWQEVYTLR